MALLRDFEVEANAKGAMHPTQVDAKIKIIETIGEFPIVQIDTFGSDHRKLEGKVSQTLQLDRRSAEKLVGILKATFRL